MVNDTLQTIQQIHKGFEVDLSELFTDLSGPSSIRRYTPIGVPAELFSEQVKGWRYHYPQNNFITERQVMEICLKYNLMLGPSFLFTGEIPQRNFQQIKNFRLMEQHKHYKSGSTFKAWVGSFFRQGEFASTFVNPMQMGGDCGFIEIESGWMNMSLGQSKNVIPVGKGMILVDHTGSGQYFECYIKVQVFESEWFVSLGKLSDNQIRVDWQTGIRSRPGSRSAGELYKACRLSLRISMRLIETVNNLNLSREVCPLVVAPGTMFDRFSESVEVNHGYRLNFKEAEILGTAPNWGDFVDDPIVLQPVPGGYLVVTKWGQEAYLPEVQEPGLN